VALHKKLELVVSSAPRLHEPSWREFSSESWVLSVRAVVDADGSALFDRTWIFKPANIACWDTGTLTPTSLPHSRHIQFIAINRPAICISHAFYRVFHSNINHFCQALSLWSPWLAI